MPGEDKDAWDVGETCGARMTSPRIISNSASYHEDKNMAGERDAFRMDSNALDLAF